MKKAKTQPICETPEYKCWAAMRNRCRNPNNRAYRLYGGRGITICPEWDDFSIFLRDMGTRPSLEHSIERIDVNGNYEPANCKWATRLEQANNLRRCRFLTFRGKTQTVTQWSRVVGLRPECISYRIQRGWSVEKALTEPNKRKSDSFAQKCREVNLAPSTVRNRMERGGLTMAQALSAAKQPSGRFTLTEQDVEDIKEYRKTHTLVETAAKFGCANSHVSRIVNGVRRKHIVYK